MHTYTFAELCPQKFVYPSCLPVETLRRIQSTDKHPRGHKPMMNDELAPRAPAGNWQLKASIASALGTGAQHLVVRPCV